MAATKIFVSCFSDLEDFWDDLPVSRLEVIWKLSRLLGSLLTKSFGLPGSRLDFQEVVWTSRKSSGLPGSHLAKSPFHNRSERFGFSDLEDFWDDLPVSRLEVIWKSSGLLGSLLTKSSGLPKSRLDFLLLTKSSKLPGSRLDFLKVVWTSWKSYDKVFFHIKWIDDLQLSHHRLVLQLKKKTSRFNYIQTTYNSVVHETTEMLQISKSIAKITSALTRRLPGKSSTARRLKGKSSTARRLPNSLAYIRLLQAHRITNESHPPRIVSFYDSMNHKKFRIKILGFFSSLWRENERYVVFSSQEWKKKKGKSILEALRASNWLFMVVVVLMTMAIL
ncbi:hypothetical protein IGI04_040169 [Brassica rapa subsp. trilocularis]|uniref:Reverse transcriptase zinc-binding domain-containing protein n=1 Tax=Brassica rapa subsp. trilocularis TaxID=1813537 RepID=A0ABQ7KMV6_BRACM|nr:hypothetical protein IGI04_040169 [Brassica rapa subsp. trilocularis]